MTKRPERRRWYRAALLLPFVWQLACAPLVNGVRWSVAGLPFPMLWQMVGVLIASAAIAIVFHADERRDTETDEAPR